MQRIARLPDDVVNQIAAGEVVERPASVVKELLENALDAEATRIVIELEQGGKRLIRVRDDGLGIDPSDLSMAIERHATSKLRNASDLEHIASSGFRGEALPSIGSVAELSIISRTGDASEGAMVSVSFSRATPTRPAGHPVGTTVEVRNLFAEIPARRKFLRAESTELRHAVEIVSLLAMSRSAVGFTIRADGREVLALPPAASLEERVAGVLGRDLAGNLAPVDYEEQGIAVSGFVSRDPSRGGARPDIRAYVNGRPVKDRGLSKAVSEAYRALGHFDAKPSAVIFVDVGLDMVDVNVHPAKTEVRFREASRVFQTVVRAVRRALAGPSEEARPNPWAARFARSEDRGGVAVATGLGSLDATREAYAVADSPSAQVWDSTPAAEGASRFGSQVGVPATILGQFRDTYIVASLGGDLWLFDQHTSHERARFEAIERRKAGERAQSQALLEPVVIEVSSSLALLAEEASLELYALGFELESFGAGSLLVRSIPHLLTGRDPAEAVQKILRQIEDGAHTQWAVEGRTHRLAASLACHSAVRAGQKINQPTMQEIVDGLLASEFQDYCPHGRPTRHRIPKEDVARWFERTGWRRS
ncbi:MAG: DNA mismatch repair endonuclease MutL [Vicinamibacteria bacterium]|nr:DNA mismatch repair endonuclease MutL [Vicinamibacteria bacterium]